MAVPRCNTAPEEHGPTDGMSYARVHETATRDEGYSVHIEAYIVKEILPNSWLNIAVMRSNTEIYGSRTNADIFWGCVERNVHDAWDQSKYLGWYMGLTSNIGCR